MKVKHFFGLAVLAAMTASCSSNDELVNNVSGNEASEAAVGYAAFSINLPSVSTTTTRAGESKDDGGATMNGGTAAEYAVKDATAIILKKILIMKVITQLMILLRVLILVICCGRVMQHLVLPQRLLRLLN